MRVRAKVNGNGRPRPDWAVTAALAMAAIVLVAPAERASAQAISPDWLSPSLESDPSNPPAFKRQRTAQAAPTNQFSPLPHYGTPPAAGAGNGGFNSTNAAAARQSPSSAGSTGFRSANPPPPALNPPSALPPDTVAAGRRGAPPIPVAIDGSDNGPVVRRKPFHKRGEPDDPYEPLGIEAGSFVLKPAIELSGGYDTNPARDTIAKGGAVAVVAPELKVQSNWSRHELRAEMFGRYTTYPGFQATPSLDQPYASGKVNGRIDVRRNTRIDLEGRAELSTENPNSPDLQAGLARLPTVIARGGTVGIAQRFNRVELGVSGSFDRIEYGDSLLTDGSTASNRDRNFDQQGIKLRGSYDLSPGISPFVEAAADKRVHDLPIDAFGQQRDSTGRQISVGTTFALTHLLTGSLAVGYAQRRYEDPTLPELAGPIADGSLAWSVSPLTKVTLTARSTTGESTLQGVSGVLSRDLGVQVEHAFRRWLTATVRFNYGLDDYVGSPREDQRYRLAGLITYKLSREVQLKGEVRHEWQVSNAGADFTADIFLLGVRLQR